MRLMLPNEKAWRENPSLRSALGLDKMDAPIISVVGAGGKTSTIEYLAKEYGTLHKQVIVTTTTHMYRPEVWTWCREESMELVDKYLEKEDVLWIGSACGNDKMSSPRYSFLEQLVKKKIPILIEADGARRLPFKVPGENEPVIFAESNFVIGILGMDALGKPLKEVCFRSALASEYLHKSEDLPVTAEDYISIIQSPRCLNKGVTEQMKYIIILNKVDDEQREYQALEIRDTLQKLGIDNVILSSYKKDPRQE